MSPSNGGSSSCLPHAASSLISATVTALSDVREANKTQDAGPPYKWGTFLESEEDFTKAQHSTVYHEELFPTNPQQDKNVSEQGLAETAVPSWTSRVGGAPERERERACLQGYVMAVYCSLQAFTETKAPRNNQNDSKDPPKNIDFLKQYGCNGREVPKRLSNMLVHVTTPAQVCNHVLQAMYPMQPGACGIEHHIIARASQYTAGGASQGEASRGGQGSGGNQLVKPKSCLPLPH
eukprot:2432737-Amphidinium_carterae.1